MSSDFGGIRISHLWIHIWNYMMIQIVATSVVTVTPSRTIIALHSHMACIRKDGTRGLSVCVSCHALTHVEMAQLAGQRGDATIVGVIISHHQMNGVEG